MAMLRTAGWYIYPWNLHSPGEDIAAMRTSGMTHAAIASSYHAGKFVQPRDPRSRVYFPEDGTVYFRADSARYGRLKPRISQITAERDVLREACDSKQIPIRAWTVLNHNSRLGWQHPEIVAKNAWGDPYYYSLCPAHGDVQEYAVALCRDLSEGYDIDCLLLESPGWLTYDHGYHHEFAQVQLPDEAARLLALCFCDACIAGSRNAGIDAVALGRAVIERVDALLTHTALPDPVLDETLSAFDRWRAGVVSALCERIRHEVIRAVGLRAISTCQRPHRTAYREGHDLIALAAAIDGLELPIYQSTTAAALEDLDFVTNSVKDVGKLSVILRPGAPDIHSQAQLEETLRGVLSAGVDDVSFYNFGLLPQTSLDWTREMVALTRRLEA